MNKTALGLLLLFSLSACMSNKSLLNTSSNSANEVLKKSQEKAVQLDWFTAQLKGKAQFNDNEYPINAQLRMRKDSVIWISVSAILGLEALRVQLTPDSLKLINRLTSSYFLGQVSALSSQYNIPLTFEEIQNALLGRHSFTLEHQFKLNSLEGNYVLLAEKDNHSFVFQLSENYLPQEIITRQSDSAYVRLAYPNFVEVDSQWLPQNIELEAITNNKNLNANFSYSKMLVNRPKKIKFSIPSSYAPM